jgi:hypothetical protein
MKRLRVVLVRAASGLVGVLSVLVVAILVACGPHSLAARPYNFVVIVQNKTAYPDDVTIRSALGGVYLTSAKQLVPANGQAVWVLGTVQPDLVEIDSLALTTGYGPPDWRPGTCLVVSYPDGFTRWQAWPSRPEER